MGEGLVAADFAIQLALFRGTVGIGVGVGDGRGGVGTLAVEDVAGRIQDGLEEEDATGVVNDGTEGRFPDGLGVGAGVGAGETVDGVEETF